MNELLGRLGSLILLGKPIEEKENWLQTRTGVGWLCVAIHAKTYNMSSAIPTSPIYGISLFFSFLNIEMRVYFLQKCPVDLYRNNLF